MKKIFYLSIVFQVLLLVILTSCTSDIPTEIPPKLATTDVSWITYNAASCGGNITADSGYNVTVRGVCWSTTDNPTIADSKTTDGTGSGAFTSSITGLTPGKTYYVRAYASTGKVVGYGETHSFKTTLLITFNQDLTYGSVTDVEGNVYNTITIGNQTWMAENLRTTKYRNGEAIPLVTDNTAWLNLTTGACCNYNNDTANISRYGKLYNGYAVTDSRNIAPSGWHVPTDEEWTRLTTYLGSESVAGGKLKETGTGNWLDHNTGATNESGFSALPGGDRGWGGSFTYLGYMGNWWCSSVDSDNYTYIWCRRLEYDLSSVIRGVLNKEEGLSVRCVKD